MREAWTVGVSTLLLTFLLTGSLAHAAIFPDVPDSHIYRESIERLVGLRVINGNPDGTFRPARAVNRAEMLTMLYRAIGITPELGGANCFPDIVAGSWYEAVVCHAAAQRNVEGYSDGRFRPEREVNRVEALKMIMNMFDLPVAELTGQTRDVVKFVDVSLSAWYTKYLYAAFTNGILPIAGQVGARFYPDAPLLRGEAAAYIDNALNVKQKHEEQAASIGEGMLEEGGSAEGSAASAEGSLTASSVAGPVIKQVDFPFGDDGTFAGKQPILYRFELKSRVLADINVRLATSGGGVSCTLFKLKEDGLSAEYYLGLRVGKDCWMRVALGAGSYQLDLYPSVPDGPFALMAKATTGDGNDGFSEAKGLLAARSGTLEVDDYADWYTFTLQKETTMTVQLSAPPQVDALIYPMDDVDLYGFSGPVANASYAFPPGTYVVAVRRGDPAFGRLTYTLQLK